MGLEYRPVKINQCTTLSNTPEGSTIDSHGKMRSSILNPETTNRSNVNIHSHDYLDNINSSGELVHCRSLSGKIGLKQKKISGTINQNGMSNRYVTSLSHRTSATRNVRD